VVVHPLAGQSTIAVYERVCAIGAKLTTVESRLCAMDVQEEIAEAEKGIFEAKLRSMRVVINFAPGFLQLFQVRFGHPHWRRVVGVP